MIRRLCLAALAAMTLLIAPLPAHEGHEHKILGTVTMAAADHVMLEDRAGKAHTIAITSATKVLREKKPAAVADIKPGLRVVVSAVSEKTDKGQRMRATRIELGAMARRDPRR